MDVFFLPNSRYFEYVPLDGHVELAEIHANIDYIGALHFVDVPQVNLFRVRRGEWNIEFAGGSKNVKYIIDFLTSVAAHFRMAGWKDRTFREMKRRATGKHATRSKSDDWTQAFSNNTMCTEEHKETGDSCNTSRRRDKKEEKRKKKEEKGRKKEDRSLA